MSDGEFEKNGELEKLSLNSGSEDFSDLDEYGVWIKGHSDESNREGDTADETVQSSDSLSVEESDGQAFDFDGLSEDVSLGEDDSHVMTGRDDSPKSDSEDSSFDDIDMSDFFTDFDSDANVESDEKEDEVSIKMDLNFDTVDSYAEKDEEDDFDAMLDDPNIEVFSSDRALDLSVTSDEGEINDLLSDLNSPSSAVIEDRNDQDMPSIELNIDVDETQDFAKLADNKEDTSISISFSSTEEVEQKEKVEGKDSEIVVKDTVIEPENIDDIIEKNRQVLGEEVNGSLANEQIPETCRDVSSSAETFSDVEALAKDLTDGLPTVPTTGAQMNDTTVISVAGLDKVTELLQNMTQELVSIREEIASLKRNVSHFSAFSKHMGVEEKGSVEEDDTEQSGFFKDEDTDEAIALTGDELNNILITADFTEEPTNEEKSEGENIDISELVEEKNFEGTASIDETCGKEESIGSLETNIDDEIEIDEETDFETNQDSNLNFDDITLENAKLDDFVIPEELDYNMLNSENESSVADDVPEKAEGTDMSYLDEKDSSSLLEDESQEIPESQDLPVSSDSVVSTQKNGMMVLNDSEDGVSLGIKKDELPSNIKRDIKSVLSYMDQLLESLPEDKMKEFAESEYFEMYNRLFNELGIS